MRKSQKREYELDRKYDMAEWYSPIGKRFTKRRARRRYRSTWKGDIVKELAENEAWKRRESAEYDV